MLFYRSKKWLQYFDFRSSPYMRPTQRWRCGWAAEGKPCLLGPDAKGRCNATFECRPMNTGERWQCARPDSRGGRCSEAPLPDGTCTHAIPPCTPIPRLRALRGMTVRWVSAITVGIMLLLVGGAYGLNALSSGPLTTHHAEIGNCASCHSSFDKGPAHWLVAAFTENTEVADSRLCLTCHTLGNDPLKPHNQNPEVLWAVSQSAAPASSSKAPSVVMSLAQSVFNPGENLDGPLPCRTCHQEHDGRGKDITEMSSARCQACHRTKFASLSSGHPEFGKYPFVQRTNLVFDHVSHIGKHFAAEKSKAAAPKNCRSCHAPDATGRTMVAKGFDEVCAACHLGQIEGEGRAGSKGMVVFAVPGLDVATLRELGVAIGEWPEDAEDDLPPFMDFLFSGDIKYVDARKAFEDLDLLDLSDANEAQLAAVRTLAWAVKDLLFDLEINGVSALKTRIEQALERKLKKEELSRLSGLLPVDAMRSALRQWFPNLLSEVTRRRAGETVSVPNETRKSSADGIADMNTAAGGTKAGQSESDESAAASAVKKLSAAQRAMYFTEKQVSNLLQLSLVRLRAFTKQKKGPPLTRIGVENFYHKDRLADWLQNNVGGSRKKDRFVIAEKEDQILDEDKKKDAISGDKGDGEKDEGDAKDTDVADAEGDAPEPISDEKWSSAGGWYRDEFVLIYEPSGHADAFMRAWLDVAGMMAGTTRQESALRIFDTLSAPQAPGFCAKCHSVDEVAGGTLRINWTGTRLRADARAATRFSHISHFSMLGDKGCLTCHTFDTEADYQAGFKDHDPTTFASNFRPAERKLCASCHTNERAGETCTSCHNYHVGIFPPATAHMPMILGTDTKPEKN